MNAHEQMRITSLLYEGMLSSEGWEYALQELAGLTGAAQALLLVWDHSGNRFGICEGYTGDPLLQRHFMREYHNEFEAVDPSKSVAYSIPMGTVYQDHRHIGERTIATSPFYAEFYDRYGIRANMAARLTQKNGLEYVLSFQREKARGNFDIAADRALMRLMPHLQQAAELRFKFSQLHAQAAMGSLALDHLSFPVLLVHASGEVALANQAAHAWMAQPGCGLMQGRTGAHKSAMKQLLDQACGFTGQARTAGLKVLSTTDQTAAYVIAIPLRQQPNSRFGQLSHQSMAMFVVQGKQWEPPEVQTLLKEIFGLTQAEIRLMQCLLNDMTLSEAAERLSVALETARSQLKSIFQRTGTRRQSELLRLMTKVLGAM